MMASSFMGVPLAGTPRERFEVAAASPGAQIAPVGEGMMLVVDCEAEVPDAEPQNVIDLGDFALSVVSDETAPQVCPSPARIVQPDALLQLAARRLKREDCLFVIQ